MQWWRAVNGNGGVELCNRQCAIGRSVESTDSQQQHVPCSTPTHANCLPARSTLYHTPLVHALGAYSWSACLHIYVSSAVRAGTMHDTGWQGGIYRILVVQQRTRNICTPSWTTEQQRMPFSRHRWGMLLTLHLPARLPHYYPPAAQPPPAARIPVPVPLRHPTLHGALDEWEWSTAAYCGVSRRCPTVAPHAVDATAAGPTSTSCEMGESAVAAGC